MNYQETLDFLYTQLPMYQKIGAAAFKKDLVNIKKLMRALQNPELDFPSIHIAGTNGKGSIAHMLSAIFQMHGYKVGLYTSPHYLDFRERIKINGKPISEAFVCQFTERILKEIKDIQASFFELTVAMAFDAFRSEKVDIAIVETGLGGRLDSTNIVQPILSIISNIGLDHTEMLGNTIAEIAKEKAGIIKDNTACLIGEKEAESSAVFESVAKEKKADLYFAEDILAVHNFKSELDKNSYDLKYQDEAFLNIENFELTGAYQKHNIQTVLAAVEILRTKNNPWKLNRETSINAIGKVRSLSKFMGRFQKLQEQPLFICDSAHNAHGLKRVLEQISLVSNKFKRIHIVFAVVKEKDLSSILPLFDTNYQYYWAAAKIARALPAEELQAIAKTYAFHGAAYTSVADAVDAALANAEKDDLIFAGASIFTVAEIPQLKAYADL